LKTRVGFAVAFAILCAPSIASAQNADSFFFGDEAALASGAVVASGTDSGALWYNPAGFGGLKRGLISASASTFGLRFRTIPRALRVRLGGQERAVSLSSADVISVPNAVVAATQLGDKYALAGGLLTTSRDVRAAAASSPDFAGVANDGTAAIVNQRIDIQHDDAKYHLGAAFAAKASEKLRLGAALFVTYAKANTNVHYALDGRSNAVPPTDEKLFIVQSGRATTSAIGLAFSLGAQYDVSPLIKLGITVRSPELAITSSTDGSVVTGVASVGGTDPPQAALDATPAPNKSAGGKLVAPTRILVGAAYQIAPRSWLEVGVDFAHGLPATEVKEAQQPQINGRAGVRYMLSPSFILGGGLFTDRSTFAKVPQFLTSDRVDYYGLTLGVSKRTPLALVKDPKPEALVLVTTLSLRSSVGFGQARAVTIDLDNVAGQRDDRSDVTFFEVMPYLGSTVDF
jgi:hypothetical protein